MKRKQKPKSQPTTKLSPMRPNQRSTTELMSIAPKHLMMKCVKCGHMQRVVYMFTRECNKCGWKQFHLVGRKQNSEVDEK